MAAPDIRAASPETRKARTAAISAGLGQRSCFALGMAARLTGVSVMFGMMQLTRPVPPRCRGGLTPSLVTVLDCQAPVFKWIGYMFEYRCARSSSSQPWSPRGRHLPGPRGLRGGRPGGGHGLERARAADQAGRAAQQTAVRG